MINFSDPRKSYRLLKDIHVPATKQSHRYMHTNSVFDRYLTAAIELKRTRLFSDDEKFFIIPAGSILIIKDFTWKRTLDRFEYSLQWLNPLFKGIQFKSTTAISETCNRYSSVRDFKFFNYELEPVDD